MDLSSLLSELYEERKRLEQAILSLEELARGRKRGPGRPRGRTKLNSERPWQTAVHGLAAGFSPVSQNTASR